MINMVFDNTYLLLSNFAGLIVVWLRIESRLSRLEGRFDQFLNDCNISVKEVKKDG